MSTTFVRNEIKNGSLGAFTVGRSWRIPLSAVEEYEARDVWREREPCDVYLIRCGDYIKIGKAVVPQKRLAALQAANPLTLELLHVLTDGDGHELEIELHRRFAAHRHRGEWFRIEGTLAEWVEGGCTL